MARVLDAMWGETMAQHPSTMEADSLLCGLARADYDLDDLFDRRQRDSPLSSRRQIAELIIENALELPQNRQSTTHTATMHIF